MEVVDKRDLQTREFTWILEKISKLKAEKHYSDSFVVGGYKWRVSLYPKGNRNLDDLAVYLDVPIATTLPDGWSQSARFKLSVINQFVPEETITKGTQTEFNEQRINWGFTSIMPLKELHGPSRGFLVNDTLIVKADVTVDNDSKKDIAEHLQVPTPTLSPASTPVRAPSPAPGRSPAASLSTDPNSAPAPSPIPTLAAPGPSPASPPSLYGLNLEVQRLQARVVKLEAREAKSMKKAAPLSREPPVEVDPPGKPKTGENFHTTSSSASPCGDRQLRELQEQPEKARGKSVISPTDAKQPELFSGEAKTVSLQVFEEWVSNCEDFFKFQNVPDHKWVLIGTQYLSGTAKLWFKGSCRENEETGVVWVWADFIEALKYAFVSRDSALEAWIALIDLEWHGDLQEYVEKHTKLCNDLQKEGDLAARIVTFGHRLPLKLRELVYRRRMEYKTMHQVYDEVLQATASNDYLLKSDLAKSLTPGSKRNFPLSGVKTAKTPKRPRGEGERR